MKLLCGDFSESQKSEVELGFQGNLLLGIAHYCYTDQPLIFTHDLENKASQKCEQVLELRRAADYFGFPKLYTMYTNMILCQIPSDSTLCWKFLRDNCNNDEEIEETVWKVIRTNLKGMICPVAPIVLKMIDVDFDNKESGYIY